MRRLLISLVTAAALVVAVVPAVLAAEPSPVTNETAATPAPTDGTQEPTPAPTGPYDGTIVVDPTFVSGGELPTQPAPAAPARSPRITPPPTDAAAAGSSAAGATPLPMLLLLVSAVIALLASPTRAPSASRIRHRT